MSSINLKNKIFNKMLKNGVKTHPEKILKNSIKKIQKKNKKNYLEVLKKSLINASPILSIKQIKRRKKQVKEFPYILKKKLRLFFGLKFILSSLNNKKNSFYNEFSEEILSTAQFKGNAIKLKKELYEKSFQKKKYANFRWF